MDKPTEHYGLRTAVYNVFSKWEQKGLLRVAAEAADHGPRHLWKLIYGDKLGGFYPGMTMDDRAVEICRGLAGPHGWAYYKMLLARR